MFIWNQTIGNYENFDLESFQFVPLGFYLLNLYRRPTMTLLFGTIKNRTKQCLRTQEATLHLINTPVKVGNEK